MASRVDRAVWWRAAALVFGGGVVGLGLNVVRPGGVALRDFSPPATCTAGAEPGAEAEPVGTISARDASSLCGQRDVIFADTRSPAAFAEGHIADALHLPCDSSSSVAADAAAKLGQARLVVIYGEARTDEAGASPRAVAETLRRRGLNVDLRVLDGGFTAWEAAGLACASGPCRECTAQSTQGKESAPR